MNIGFVNTKMRTETLEKKYQAWREHDGPLLDWTAKTADAFLGILPGLESGVTTASAGAARGVVYAAGLSADQEKLVMGANLAALGVALASIPANSAPIQIVEKSLPGLLGAALVAGAAQVRSGFSRWEQLPETVRGDVHSATQKALDLIVPPVDEPTRQQRVVGGLTGEVVGLVTGGWVGVKHGFESAQGQGQQLVDWAQGQIFQNMHEEPEWKSADRGR